MTKDSPEYIKFKAEYDADQMYRKDHPELFPWFFYEQFGWHLMTFLTNEEAQESIKFYHLWKRDDDHYQRVGRQPIFLSRRGEQDES